MTRDSANEVVATAPGPNPQVCQDLETLLRDMAPQYLTPASSCIRYLHVGITDARLSAHQAFAFYN